jgi:hypothetical protein
MSTTVHGIKTLVATIVTLSNSLPKSVPNGSMNNKIWAVMHTDEGDTTFETFNRHFDALFGEDCRNSDGWLHHIRQEKNGLGLICTYLNNIDWSSNIPLDLVEIKLVRLSVELKHLAESHASPVSARPSRQRNPTFKLRDTDNAEKAELSFQRKAVEEYHMRQPVHEPDTPHVIQPQPLPPFSPLNSLALSPSANSTAIPDPPTIVPQRKRSIAATIEEVDTEHDEDSDITGMCPGTSFFFLFFRFILNNIY